MLIRISILLLLLLAGCSNEPKEIVDRQLSEKASSLQSSGDTHDPTIEAIVETERTILDLAPFISQIGDSLTESRQTSKERLREIFANEVRYKPDSGDAQVTDDFLNALWQPFLGPRKFTESQFGTLSGTFDEAKQNFAMKTEFRGKLRTEKDIVGVAAKQTITWTRINKLWTITSWDQHSFEVLETPTGQPLFRDATAEFITDPALLKKVSESSHQQMIGAAIKSNTVMDPLVEGLPGFNDWESLWQFPSVSVVDYDNDGWDDIFLTDRWSGGMMLKNKEGTLVDVTDDCGLEVGLCTNCVVFADFDNDGDSDAFVGRSLHDSQYFVNENGIFRHDTTMDGELKHLRFVTAGSVADFNRDGLLDLYVSTYVAPSASAEKNWHDEMLPESDRQRVRDDSSKHPFVDRGGPANVLLINVNGKLKRCETGDELKQWRDSFQSAWHDWDGDGDPDLFVCNDYAPDAFLRNDTQPGSLIPNFTDVTSDLIGDKTMGYSMGASWGDYDNDADMDLFVTGMYSKAGNRILNQFAEADQRSVFSAKGNFLFQNSAGSFKQVAGTGANKAHVAKAGWSFGGQFADFDADGWLDLYVPSGFYTAPESIRSDADL